MDALEPSETKGIVHFAISLIQNPSDFSCMGGRVHVMAWHTSMSPIYSLTHACYFVITVFLHIINFSLFSFVCFLAAILLCYCRAAALFLPRGLCLDVHRGHPSVLNSGWRHLQQRLPAP